MLKPEHTVADFMTPMPYTIDGEETLVKARALMREFNIRHLPVIVDFKIRGLLAQQEVESIAAHAGSKLSQMLVAEAMMLEPFLVKATTPLAQVTAHMAKTKIGCALVIQDGGALVGIFTDIDALRALSSLCQSA